MMSSSRSDLKANNIAINFWIRRCDGEVEVDGRERAKRKDPADRTGCIKKITESLPRGCIVINSPAGDTSIISLSLLPFPYL